MSRETIYLRQLQPEKSLSAHEVARASSITDARLRSLERQYLLRPRSAGGTYRQRDADQVHNVIILQRLFALPPSSLWHLYRAVGDYVSSVPLKDKDLLRYSNRELSEDPTAC